MIGNSFLHLVKVWLLQEKPASQTTEKEQQAIAHYAQGAVTAVEIGVFEGVNTAIISRSMANDGILYGIDPFFKGRLGISYHKLVAKLSISRNGNRRNVRFLEMLSFDASHVVPGDLDFVFIDGDHSFEGVKKDWEIFSSKLKKGGIIALHDTSIPPHNPSVAALGSYRFFTTQIVHDPRFEIIKTVDSLNILQRNK
jgi:predicted O-methyltransferase YrrM